MPECPILVRIREQLKLERLHGLKELQSATPPSVLVGEYGYPHVRVGVNLPLSGEGEPALFESPSRWWGRLSLYDIVRLRAGLVFSYSVMHVGNATAAILEAVQEAAASVKPVDSEAFFKKPPTFRMRFDPLLKPVGLSGHIEKLRLVDNPSIPRHVESFVSDRVKAKRALIELYSYGFDVYYLQRLLTSGLLGVEKKLVPTRWAITAVDKTLGDHLLRRVREYPEVADYEVYHSNYIGNRYTILLIPESWSMEMLEIWMPHSVWVPGDRAYISAIHEWGDGAPSGEDGGYQAIRFAVLESLAKRGRQAACLAIREITPEYFAPVGNWQIREGVKGALQGKPIRARSVEEALQELSRLTLTPLSEILSRSLLLRSLRVQRRLPEFLKNAS